MALIISFHSHEMPRISKSIETESRFVVAWGGKVGWGGWGKAANGFTVSFGRSG